MPEQTRDTWDDSMSRATDSVVNEAAASSPRSSTGKAVCPYCGAVNERSSAPCPRCTMEDTPATRAATKARIGPWYILQSRNPSAPGMKWSTLLSLVNRGQVTPRSIVRGPTTHQLWRFAGNVKGLSRELGLCYSCGLEIAKTANQCPHCDRLQEPPINPDALLEVREPAPRAATVQREIRSAEDLPESSPKNDLAVRDEELPRDWKPDAGILSAKELAAAFQLDFKPSASAPAKEPVLAPRKKRSGGKIAALLLFLAAGGVAAVMYFKPEYRTQVVAQWDSLTEWTQQKWNSLNAPEKPNPLKDIQSNPANETKVVSSNPEQTQVAPFQPEERKPSENTPVEPPPRTPQGDPPQIVQPVMDPSDQSRQWWGQALDAEARGQYADAVQLYEKIKLLPQNVWPINLELKLQQARDQLKK